jgi:hypothetical protein
LRRGLETDRYGLVAHVLLTRGCTGADCAELRLLRDPGRVVANMKARAFESALGVHALAWQPNGANPAVASSPPSVPVLANTGASTPAASAGAGASAPNGSTTVPNGSATVGSSRFDFPSASSIPAVSIMNPEPTTPPAAEPRPTVPTPKRAVMPPRRPNAREAATPPVPHPPPPAPTPPPAPAPQAAPEPAPAEPVAPSPPARPDQHSVR